MKNSFDIMAALKYNEPEKMAATLHTMSDLRFRLHTYILLQWCYMHVGYPYGLIARRQQTLMATWVPKPQDKPERETHVYNFRFIF